MCSYTSNCDHLFYVCIEVNVPVNNCFSYVRMVTISSMKGKDSFVLEIFSLSKPHEKHEK